MEIYTYWEIWYTSCESNRRWTVARAPIGWDEYQVRERIPMGGCGDDVAEVISVDQVGRTDSDYVCWDFYD